MIQPERLRELFDRSQHEPDGWSLLDDEFKAIVEYIRKHDDDLAADLAFAFPLAAERATTHGLIADTDEFGEDDPDAVRIDGRIVIEWSAIVPQDVWDRAEDGDGMAEAELAAAMDKASDEALECGMKEPSFSSKAIEAWLIDGAQGHDIVRLKKWSE